MCARGEECERERGDGLVLVCALHDPDRPLNSRGNQLLGRSGIKVESTRINPSRIWISKRIVTNGSTMSGILTGKRCGLMMEDGLLSADEVVTSGEWRGTDRFHRPP